MRPARCRACGARQGPNPLPWLALPLLLGGGALAFLKLWGDELSVGLAVLVVTLPFAAFLFVLRQFTLAWAAVETSACRRCGADDPTAG